MIRPRPGTDAWKLLTLVVEHPGEVSPAEAAAILWPMPPQAAISPPGLGVTLYDYRAAVKARQHDRAEWQARTRAKAVRLLGRLQEAGLVESRVMPRLATWWAGGTVEEQLQRLQKLLRADESDMLDEEPAAFAWPASPETMLRLIADVREGRGLRSQRGAREGRGLRAERNGTEARAWRVLRELGVVVDGSLRSPTDAGKALVRGGS